MATAYTSLLGLALPVQGELQGTWGDTVNNAITSLLDTAVAGTTTLSTDADVTLSTTTGAANQARQAILLWTANGTVTRNITAPAQSKIYTVINNSAGTQSIVIRGVGPTTGVTIPKGKAIQVVWNGSDFVELSPNSITGNLTVDGNLTVNGNTTLGDTSSDTITLNGTVQPGVVISGSSSGDALRITQTGAGNAFVVEDSANPDATPFVIDASGNVIKGATTAFTSASALTAGIQAQSTAVSASSLGLYSFNTTANQAGRIDMGRTRGALGAYDIVQSGDQLGVLRFTGGDGTQMLSAAEILAQVDGTPGTNDMPGRLVFSTTADGASSPTERMRIDSAGAVGIGSTALTGYTLRLGKNITGAVSPVAVRVDGVIQTDVTNTPVMFQSRPTTAASTSLSNLYHYTADPQTFGAGTTVVDQIGFYALGSLTGATNNYGFFSNIAAATGRWNFYANGTANNYFAGDVLIATTTAVSGSNLVVASGDATIYGLTVGRGAGAISTNTAVGASALAANTTGSDNTAFGWNSLALNTTGLYNTAVGRAALYANTTASGNTGLGFGALSANTTGASNVAVGREALLSNTTASNNTAVGTLAAYGNTTGTITAFGSLAGYGQTTGTLNTFLGQEQGSFNTVTGSSNSGVGYRALLKLSSGSNNTAIGQEALRENTTASDNTAVGFQALYANTTAAQLVAVGAYALFSSTTGRFNTAVGYEAGRAVTTGEQNNFFGFRAGYSTTTGSFNTALSQGAMQTNTTGARNVAVGTEALYSNTTASNNTAVGYQAGFSNTTGAANTALGAEALNRTTTGEQNVAVGRSSLYSNTTGSVNTAVGAASAISNTTGDYIAALGWQSLYYNTTGRFNVAIGCNALLNNTTANNNTAVGTFALDATTTGASNTAVGVDALGSNTTGNSNTAVGLNSLIATTTGTDNTAIGISSGADLTTGSNNTILGDQAGRNYTGGGGAAVTTGSNNTIIGFGATPTAAAADNQIIIGSQLLGLGNNYFTFGKGAGADRVYNQFTANATWTRSSDQRLKKDIQTNTELGLGFINDIRTVHYKWKAPSEIEQGVTGHDPDVTQPSYANKMYGFIAQEVKSALDKHGVTDFSGWHVTPEEQGAIQGVSYEMFVVPLVNAVKELSVQVTALQAEITQLKGA